MAGIEAHVERWLGHIRALAQEIGARGSTTDSERLASEYCRRTLEGLGLEAKVECFRSARSIYQPHLLAASLMLLSFAIYPVWGRTSAAAAALMAMFALGSDLLELSFRDNLLRRAVPKGMSQNVVATISPRESHLQDLILIGHVDSHRTPIIFSTARWVRAYQAFTTIAFLLFLAQAALYVIGALTEWPWIWPVTLLSVVGALALIAICAQADSTPFSSGANDNASGAGLVLALAGHAVEAPLRHTRLWLACTGCEEVQHYGAIDFFHQHRGEMREPRAVVFEMMGCAGPAWLTREGIVIPFKADPQLADLAAQLSRENPEWHAHPARIRGGNTEMADALRAGVPAITLTGMTAQDEAPFWHQAADTYDKMDRAILTRAYALTWSLIAGIDDAADAGRRGSPPQEGERPNTG